MADRDTVLATLLDGYGQTFADELGIDVAKNTPRPLFELLVMSLLMSARISSDTATRASRALLRGHGLNTPQKMLDATWQERVDALGEGGYVRYDESTASYLADTASLLLDDYDGDLRNLREQAERDPQRERKELKRCKGLGDVGVNIFFREVQGAWAELHPFADDRVLDTAAAIGLPDSAGALGKMVSRSDFPRLVAALGRLRVAGDEESVRHGRLPDDHDGPDDLANMSKSELYDLARERDLDGRSSMSKDELADALDEGSG